MASKSRIPTSLSIVMNTRFKTSKMQRREFLQSSLIAGIASCLPRLTFANVETDSRLVLVILRGALDGIAAVPPYGDGNYQRLRGELALDQPGSAGGVLKLDGLFGLHPSLQNLYSRYQQKELLVMHAIASPYRERSHFDGQDLLENGTTQPHAALDGWLNRALPGMMGMKHHVSEDYAMAFAQNIPLVLRGDQRVGSWAPSKLPATDEDTLQRIADMYSTDSYFASRLQTAMQTNAIANEKNDQDDGDMKMDGAMSPAAKSNSALAGIVAAAGRMLKLPDGPRVAVMDASGWDTHANQGATTGQLATRLTALDAAIESLRVELGDVWQQTALLAVTEFGRTVAVNGTRGTDHGTGTCAFLVGGAVNGGRVMADWPGLAVHNLYQSRDLMPTTDLRALFKGVLRDHLGVAESLLETRVFDKSSNVKPLAGLIKTT